MLVLEPIFEADLPPELYAYRPGRNAQQAVVEVEELLFRGHPEVVDADLADYLQIANMKQPVPLLRDIQMLPGCGQWTQQERPEEVSVAIIDFLRSLTN
jgi:hypothetical protein